MLVFVPILAGLWPGVKLSINRYNQLVNESLLTLEHARESLQYQIIQIQNTSIENERNSDNINIIYSKINHILTKLEVNIDNIISDYPLKTIEKTSLPLVWVESFFSALFVLVAQVLYQLKSPEIVRNLNMQQYMNQQRNKHALTPSDQNVVFAVNNLKKYKMLFVPSVDINDRPSSEDSEMKWELDIVEQGAQSEYLHLSRTNFIYACFSGLFYFMSLALILAITYQQSFSVLKAAEFIK